MIRTKVMTMMAGAIAVAIGSQAIAGTAYYSGNLNSNSLIFDNPGGSTAGTGVHYYSVQPFMVDVTGAYTFEMSSPNTAGTPSNALDTYLRLYANSFDPSNPVGAIASNDDFTGTLTVLPGPYAGTITNAATGFSTTQPSSRLLNINLTAGTTYFLVNTSFRATDFVATTGTTSQAVGDFYTGIGGPGNITLIPAPGALALIGLAGLVGTRRRRN